jgi:hypothetical protein
MFKSSIAALALLTAASSASAFWGTAGPSAAVADSYSAEGAKWRYSYVVANTGTCFGDCANTFLAKSITAYWLSDREFALPYFSDAGIDAASITNPAGWTHEISTTNPFNLLNAGALTWRASGDSDGIALGASLSGFGYLAGFSAGKGPFSVTNGSSSRFVGDPAIPLSPMAVAAGIAPVPEPESYALMAVGLFCIGLARYRRTLQPQIGADTAAAS